MAFSADVRVSGNVEHGLSGAAATRGSANDDEIGPYSADVVARDRLQHLVFLCGSGSSGKTSLGREVVRLASDGWRVVDEDDCFYAEWLARIQQRFPVQFAVISAAIAPSNRFHALHNNLVVFEKSVSSALREQAERAIGEIQAFLMTEDRAASWNAFKPVFESLTLSRIQEALTEGKSVILDRWFISAEKVKAVFAEKFPCLHITKALVFSSLAAAVDKLHRRNREAFEMGDMSKFRRYKQLLPSYDSLYRVVAQMPDSEPRHAFCSSTRQELDALFDQAESEIAKVPATSQISAMMKELTEEELCVLRKKFLPPAIPDGPVIIESKEEYDLVIDTQALSPTSAAQHLLGNLA